MNVRHVHTHIKSAVHPQLWALVVARRTLPDAATSAHCAVLPSYPPQNGVEERCGVLAAFAHASFERLATGQREQGAYAHSHAHTPLGPVLRSLVLDGTPVKSYEALVLGFAALERTLRDVAGPTNDSSRPILRDLLAAVFNTRLKGLTTRLPYEAARNEDVAEEPAVHATHANSRGGARRRVQRKTSSTQTYVSDEAEDGHCGRLWT